MGVVQTHRAHESPRLSMRRVRNVGLVVPALGAKWRAMAQIHTEQVKLDETLDYIAGLDAVNIKEACEGAPQLA